MKVEQIYSIVNNLTSEVLGQADLATADLSNAVEVGKAIFDATSVDNYVRKLIDHIGKVVFVNRPYKGVAPSIYMDGWEYGAVLEKIDCGIPEAEANPAWNLQNGQVYEQDKFVAPTDITVKFFRDRDTFQIPISVAEDQVKSAFSNATQLNAFYSMIQTQIETSITLKNDLLAMATINNFSANVYNIATASPQKINLLKKFKERFPTSTVTADTCLEDMEFLKFAAYQIKLYSKRMRSASTLFNIGKRIRHTPIERQKIIMLDQFADAADVYLQSDTFHNEFVELPQADLVSFWQGTGTDYEFESISSINVKTNDGTGAGVVTSFSGVIACIFDRDALGINNFDRRVTAHYNAPGEFINNYYKVTAQYFNDFNENFILFYVEDVA